MSDRNHIPIYTMIDGVLVSHLSLHEIENADGLCMIHPSVPLAFELTRAELCDLFETEVQIIVTDSIRTPAENKRLAKMWGWIGEVSSVTGKPGKVSQNSKHLIKWGGIALDWKARIRLTKKPVPQEICGQVARKFWSFVKDNYSDGHIHSDMRDHV